MRIPRRAVSAGFGALLLTALIAPQPASAGMVTIARWNSGADSDAHVDVRVWPDADAGTLCVAWTAQNLGPVTKAELLDFRLGQSLPPVVSDLPIFDPEVGTPACIDNVDASLLADLANPDPGSGETPTFVGFRLFTDEFVEAASTGLFFIEERGTFATTHYACPAPIDTPAEMDAAGASGGCLVAIEEADLGPLPPGRSWDPAPVFVVATRGLVASGGFSFLTVDVAPIELAPSDCGQSTCRPPAYQYLMEDPGIGGPELTPGFSGVVFPEIDGYTQARTENADAVDNLGRPVVLQTAGTLETIVNGPLDADVIFIRAVYSALPTGDGVDPTIEPTLPPTHATGPARREGSPLVATILLLIAAVAFAATVASRRLGRG
jgi:hypothetical protein